MGAVLHIVERPQVVPPTVLTPEFVERLGRRNAAIRELRGAGYRVDEVGDELVVRLGNVLSYGWLVQQGGGVMTTEDAGETRVMVCFRGLLFLLGD